MRIHISEESHNPNHVDGNDRKILTSSSAFGILRQQLVRNIGIERIKGFLFHFGWEMGINDAKEAMKTNLSLGDLVKYGPILHISNGHIRGIKHEATFELDDHNRLLSYYATGIWIDSYEAAEHIKWLGRSKAPVCHTLIGFASGFISTIFGQTLLAKEVTCVGKGDADCRWIIKPQKEWEREVGDELNDYNETPIVEELEYTYDQLLEQKNIVTRMANFQKKLTEEIINGSDLQTIANMVYDIVQIPIVIGGIDFRTIAYAGLSQEKYLQLKGDLEQYIQKNEHHFLRFRKKIKTAIQEYLITPIFVQKEVLGYCAFIYEGIKQDNHEVDYLLLDHFANAVSLILLNEKTMFESFERMKGNFLEQILDEKLSVSEIIKRGKYTGLDLGKPYYMTVMEYKKTQNSMEEAFHLQEQIFETAFRYFNKKEYNLLVGHRDGYMILFIPHESVKHSTINAVIKEFHEEMTHKYPHVKFKFGISNRGDDIKNAAKHYEEARMALRLSIRKKIIPFQSLGIVGVLITAKNIVGVKMMAEQELGPLYNKKDPKSVELLKTLYIFLLNGGKLEQTMIDLSLSMSGLRYRIHKIESLLKKDLRDSNETHQLLLIIKALIALGEFDME